MKSTPYPLFTSLILPLVFLCYSMSGQDILLHSFATGLDAPADIIHTDGDYIYVAERHGYVRTIDISGNVLDSAFLDIHDIVLSNTGERGLLGIAFHPQYPDSSYIYCSYTGTGGASVISRFDVLSDTLGDETTEKILLTFPQPFTNHNGGDLDFDDEGYLLISSGDGGSGGDPNDYAQHLDNYYGKILRIDVDGGHPYTIPLSNPFVAQSGVLEEIYAYGLRNPWRIHYDEMSDAIYLGDVGQDNWEEVTKIEDGLIDPNCGWRCYEGAHPYNLSGCDTASALMIPPIHEYHHDPGLGCKGSITGGVLYRGTSIPHLYGKYLYADYCLGYICALDLQTLQNDTIYPPSSLGFSTFGLDANDEMYVADIFSGTIYKIRNSPNHFIYTINLDGAQSGTGSAGIGYGIATLDSTTRRLTVSGKFYGLSGSSTASHVHRGATGMTGGVVFNLSRTSLAGDTVSFYGLVYCR